MVTDKDRQNITVEKGFQNTEVITSDKSKENQKQWIEDIQLVKNSEKEEHIVSYLKWKLKNGGIFDVPFYTNPVVQDDFKNQIWKSCNNSYFYLNRIIRNENTELVKILAPLTDNVSAPDENGCTPIYWAACRGLGSYRNGQNFGPFGRQS